MSTKIAGELRVVFPDLYPYFRFEIYAPNLNLPHHQNLFSKNLCLIGRSTEFWDTKDFLANFITERLPLVLKSGQSDDPEEVADIEEHQAEPFSDYWPCHPATSVIVSSGWKIDDSYKSGSMLIGVIPLREQFLRCAVFEVYDEHDNILETSDIKLKQTFSGDKITARWVRLLKAPVSSDHRRLFEYLQQEDPFAYKIKSHRTNSGKLTVRAALFPEETSNWRKLDSGWLVVCELRYWRSYGK